MAELASLTSAHAYARQAIEAQNRSHWSQAADDHKKASTDFSRAARTTTDAEALRVLKLLESEHRRLAAIVKGYDFVPDTADGVFTSSNPSTSADTVPPSPRSTPDPAIKVKQKSPAVLAASRVGSQVRESSPSLARDIASRRGIPQPARNQSSPAAQAKARQLSPDSRRRARPTPGPKIPPSIVDSQASLQASRRMRASQDDDGFAKFYSNLTTGTMSKLSSALAFAGLPLTTEDPPPATKADARTVKASNEPDVKKFFSKAALEAVEDEHRQRGTFGHGFGPTESFYVVQTGGGTYSYADITRAQHHHQQGQLSGIDEEDDDAAFVDAKEVAGPPSPNHSRTPSAQQTRSAFGHTRTSEELELENTTLKQTLEQIATRLAVFEAHAQDASMAALTQSMASLRPDPGERVRQLESQLEARAEEQARLEALAGKQKDMLKKYQSKWEEVKKSAKEKDRVKREKEKAEKSLVEGEIAADGGAASAAVAGTG